ncbi:MAG: helicase-related protein [Reyranellaceae bacterium]
MNATPAQGRLTAVLGPTNTGKTHLAMERLLGHESGMIGFPLRLLARENYDRAIKRVGAGKVALITGEEKIQPPNARYFISTVESMPVERPVQFMAIDEIQMAADPDRGHVFTDRLLHARGLSETMVLGSDTMRPLLQRLIPSVEVIARPRFSKLSYAGTKKLSRIPRRSAVVGFSISEVYAIAETVRRQRGGTAVVMGALSPRTRNAQVGMFEAGEVDYLVATDAIGMGLNLDVGHVWFAGLRKFDGRNLRQLRTDELAQIAGRAGRHMSDGGFGTTAEVGPLDQEIVEAIENHRFDPVRAINWRNSDLDFRSLSALLSSLNARPAHVVLQQAREGEDHIALQNLADKRDIADAARSVQRVRLLWEVCQIPDFRKTMSEEHATLLAQVFAHLTSPGERLPEDWVESHVKRLERYDGDIDTLMARIAHTRTWTYISHRAGWLDRAQHWQERAAAVEERLSDALHQRLTQRFVDRRTALLVKRLNVSEELMTGVSENGEVTVEGESLGRLEGFRFAPQAAKDEAEQRAVLTTAMRALRDVIPARVETFSAAPDTELSIDPQLRLVWGGGPVARLLAGPDPLSPKVEPVASDLLDGPQREAVRLRCASWIEARIRATLPDLMAARDAELSGPARGLVFQLSEKLGAMPREPAEEQIAAVSDEDRKALARVGVRVGVYTVYIPTMLKPAAIRMRGMLWAIANGRDETPSMPGEGRTSIVMTPEMDRGFLVAVGYMPLGERAIRADIVERLAWAARQAVRASRDGGRKEREPQQGRKQPQKGRRESAGDAPVVTEWMIAAAALGEDPGIAAPAPQQAEPESEPAPEPVDDGSALASRETDGSIPVPLAWSSAERRWIEFDENAKPKAPALPPGHFRASAEMLSLVGCTEKEMTEILRDLGYRVHQPSEQTGPQPSFSMKPRFVREREERRGPDNREGRPPRRRDRERGPRPEDGAPRGEGEQRPPRREQRPPRPRDGEAAQAPRADQPRREGPRQDGPRHEGARHEGARHDGPRRDGPRRDGPRREGGRDRRDPGGPEFRLVATTEKKSDTPESDSPFAKLLELKLGKK